MNLSEVEKFLDDWPNNGEMTPQERIERLGEILYTYSDSSLMSIGYNRATVMLFIQKDTAKLPNRVQITSLMEAYFKVTTLKLCIARPEDHLDLNSSTVEKNVLTAKVMDMSYVMMKRVTLSIGSYQ